MSEARKILGEVGLILGERSSDYGDYNDMLGLISDYWSLYLGDDLSEDDVAVMMLLFKIARSSVGDNDKTADDLKDGIGYLAMAADLRNVVDEDEDEPEKISKTVEVVREVSPDWDRTEDSFERLIRHFTEDKDFDAGWEVRD